MDIETDRNKQVCRKVIEELFNYRLVNRDDEKEIEFVRSKVEAFYASNCVFFDPAHGQREGSFEELSQLVLMLEESFSGYRTEVIEMIAEDDKVCIHWSISGTHTGPYLGYAPTGKAFTIQALSLCTLKDGKIIKISQNHDNFGLLQQIGALQPQSGLLDEIDLA